MNTSSCRRRRGTRAQMELFETTTPPPASNTVDVVKPHKCEARDETTFPGLFPRVCLCLTSHRPASTQSPLQHNKFCFSSAGSVSLKHPFINLFLLKASEMNLSQNEGNQRNLKLLYLLCLRRSQNPSSFTGQRRVRGKKKIVSPS